MSADTLTINGTAVNLVSTNTSLDHCVLYARGGLPELRFSRLVGALATLPDPWSGQAVTLTLGATGTVVFSGDVQGYIDRWLDGFGWVREYRALGLANRANYIPVTDSETLTGTTVWDLPGDDPNFIGARAGQTVGQIVQQVLEMTENAGPLNAVGVGNYTVGSGPTYTLPSVTLTDLAALTIIPPGQVRISGDRILQALESFVQSCHPNHWLHVDPTGNIRFLDLRSCTNNTLTIGGDPRIGMPQLTRDFTDCYSQIFVRGYTLVQAVTIQTLPWPGSGLSDGGLQEDFAWGSYSNSAAKAAWVPADWSQPNQYGAPFDLGSCTCPDTTHITVTSSNASMTWSANQLAQGSGDDLCVVNVLSDLLGGLITQVWQARVVANTALTAGGTSTLTLDTALPATTYNAYQLFGLAQGANVVGRRYKVTNAAIGAAMLNYFPYPFAFKNANDTSASLTSTPVGTVMWPAFGSSPPYNTGWDPITVDPVNGLVYFSKPTQVVAGGLSLPVTWPANVQAFIPVAVGTLSAYAPSSSAYSGTLYTVEGISRTKTIDVPEWRDYSNQSNMNIFASEYLDSVSNVIVEGVLPYNGLNTTYLAPEQAVSIAGTSGGTAYTTGWETLALPVVSAELAFQPSAQGTSYLMALHLSNRRGRYTAENYLRPNITGAQYGGGEGAFAAPPPAGPTAAPSASTPGPGSPSGPTAGGFTGNITNTQGQSLSSPTTTPQPPTGSS